MSNISDEQLVVAAAKGDTNAIEELKERAIFGKYGIRKCLKKMGCTNEDTTVLEPRIVEILLANIPKYSFTIPFLEYGYRLAVNYSLRYKANSEVPLLDKEKHKEKAVPDIPQALRDSLGKPKHPPLEQIDLEIQSLVSLLNQFPYIRTLGSSCSGHPDRDDWKPYGGYIGIAHFGNGTPRTTLDFLIDLLMLLDNTGPLADNTYMPTSLQIAHGTRNANTTSDDVIRELYKQADAETLYHSGVPIVLIIFGVKTPML